MTIGDRFKQIRSALGMNQADMARAISVNPSLISDIERGDKEPSKKVISALILNYKINSNWLLIEQGDMYIKDISTEEEKPPKSALEQELEASIGAHPKFTEIEERLARLERHLDSGKILNGGFIAEPAPEYEAEPLVKVPYVEDIAAGPPIDQSEDHSRLISVPVRLVKKAGRYYAASIRGTSMSEAGIRDGDLVLISQSDTPRDGAIQVVRYRGKSTLKRLREVEGGGWELHYEDGSGRVIPVDSGDYQVQGDFVAVLPENALPDAPKKGHQSAGKPFKNR
jgi:SOS-response transcriptional repressor LexA